MFTRSCVLIVIVMLLVAAADSRADDSRFEQPVEVTAGGKAYVEVLYPSPVLHDVNGDGEHELIIGDLRGYLQFAKRSSVNNATDWGPSRMMQASNGQDIKFSNW